MAVGTLALGWVLLCVGRGCGIVEWPVTFSACAAIGVCALPVAGFVIGAVTEW